MKKLIALFFALTALLCFSARAETVGGICGENGGDNVKWEMNTDTGELRIFGEGLMADYYTSASRFSYPMSLWLEAKSLTIEEGVTTVGLNAFESMELLESVSLPSSIQIIKSSAFSGTSLTSVDIPNGVQFIGSYAFKGTKIREVTIPEGAKLGTYVFDGCRELKTAVLPENLTYIPDGFFQGSGLEEYTVPSNVTYIGIEAFKSCLNLRKITLHEGLIDMGKSVFSGCQSLSFVNWPSAVTMVPSYAFAGCSSLTELMLPEGVNVISNSAFEGCRALSSVILPGTMRRISDSAFRGCDALKDIELPDGLMSIGVKAFEHSGLESLTIPGSVTKVGDCAFDSCSELRSVALSENMTLINFGLFYGCENLEEINLSSLSNITSIGAYAFFGCSSLKEITVPKNVTEVYSSSFRATTSLTAIAVDPENTSFFDDGGVLFNKDKTVLIKYPAAKPDEEYTVPDGVTELDDHAFEGSYNLRKITLPESVATLGRCTFHGSENLESLILSPNISELPPYFATDCPKLTRLAIPDVVSLISSYAFGSDLINARLPGGTTEPGSSRLGSCRTLILPDSFTVNYYYSDVVLLCRSGSTAEAEIMSAAENSNREIYYFPSIIGPGEESTVVGQITAGREATVNGAAIPLWNVGKVLYASESDLKRCGYSFSWDAESRTTTITTPENAAWEVSETQQESTATADIWSSDVKFVLNGFVIPSLNIGGGESVLDINAVAERMVY